MVWGTLLSVELNFSFKVLALLVPIRKVPASSFGLNGGYSNRKLSQTNDMSILEQAANALFNIHSTA